MSNRPARGQKRRPPGAGQGGFTLVEMLVVLAIVVILGALALTKLGKTNNEIASSGLAHEILALCQQARYTAVSSGRQVQLTFQSQNPVAQLQTAAVLGNAPLDPSQFGPISAQVVALDQVQLLNVTAGAQVTGPPPGLIGSTAVTLIFFPSGTVQVPGSDSTGATIYIADQVLRYPQRVLLYGRTGFAKVLAQ